MFHYIKHIVDSEGPSLPAEGGNFSPELINFHSILYSPPLLTSERLSKEPSGRLTVSQLLEHPFIQMYSEVTKESMARWIAPIFFKFLSQKVSSLDMEAE